MKVVVGDLLALGKQDHFDVIIHGCNCFCSMGGGIARAIKEQFPAAFEADCHTIKGDRNKLGTYSYAEVSVGQHILTIVNAYTQFQFSGTGVKVDYDAMQDVFRLIKEDFTGQRIGYPLIGAGLAGGDWAKISKIIESELSGEDHTLVRLPDKFQFQPKR